MPDIKIGDRVEVSSIVSDKRVIVGYLRKLDSNYYTIQSQRGYLKIIPMVGHSIKLAKKKIYKNKKRVLFQNLLEVLADN